MSQTTNHPANTGNAGASGGDYLSAFGEALGALVTLALGIGLAFANQYVGADPATGDLGDMGLRIPALVAALLIVGQGVVMFIRLFASEPVTDEAPAVESIDEEEHAERSGEINRGNAARTPEEKPAGAEEDTSTTAFALLGIGAWLGWSNLTFTPQEPLTFLCLLAAFVLFSLGYRQVSTRSS